MITTWKKNIFPYMFKIILISTELECKAERKSTLKPTFSKRWWMHTDTYMFIGQLSLWTLPISRIFRASVSYRSVQMTLHLVSLTISELASQCVLLFRQRKFYLATRILEWLKFSLSIWCSPPMSTSNSTCCIVLSKW